jgi:hypothetical protein
MRVRLAILITLKTVNFVLVSKGIFASNSDNDTLFKGALFLQHMGTLLLWNLGLLNNLSHLRI